MMKKFLVIFAVLFVFGVTLPMTVEAQRSRNHYSGRSSNSRYVANNRRYNSRRYNNRNYNNRRYYSNRGSSRGYYNNGYGNGNGYNRRPSFYRRHRNAVNIGVGTGVGTLVGGLIGGKKGALIGAGVGAGGSALYTYKINPKKRRYSQRRYYRR